jgi:hypothetical protein
MDQDTAAIEAVLRQMAERYAGLVKAGGGWRIPRSPVSVAFGAQVGGQSLPG